MKRLLCILSLATLFVLVLLQASSRGAYPDAGWYLEASVMQDGIDPAGQPATMLTLVARVQVSTQAEVTDLIATLTNSYDEAQIDLHSHWAPPGPNHPCTMTRIISTNGVVDDVTWRKEMGAM